MDTNELVEQLLRGTASSELLSELPDATATDVIERLQQEAERHWIIDPYRSLEFADRIVAIGQARANPRQSALGMLARGDALKLLGRMDEASEAFELARNSLSQLLAQRHINVRAQARIEAESDSAISLQWLLLRIDWRIADVYKQIGDHRQAVQHYQNALATAEALSEKGNQYLTHLYMNLGFTYIALGEAPQALANLEHARRALSLAGNERLETEACHKARKSLKDMLLSRSLESDELQLAEAHVVTCPFCQLRLQLLAMEILMKPEGTCSVWRDQLHDYVDAQLAGQDEDPEFADLRRHLDACEDCAEAYALLYETLWAEQQGIVPELPTMPTLDTSFLSLEPVVDSAQHGLLDRLRDAYQTNDPEELNRVLGIFYDEYGKLVSSWVKSHPAFESSGEDTEHFVGRVFERMRVSLTRDKLSRFSNLQPLLRYLKVLVHFVIVDDIHMASAAAAEEMGLTPLDETSPRELWEIIGAKLTDEKEYLVLYDTVLLGLRAHEIYTRNQETFRNLDEVYALKQKALEHLRRDPDVIKAVQSVKPSVRKSDALFKVLFPQYQA